MELSEIRAELENMASRLADFRGLFDLESKEARIAELDEKMAEPEFWNDQQKAQTVINEANGLKEYVNSYHQLSESHEEPQMTHDLLKEEPDQDLQQELEKELKSLTKELNEFELQ